MTENQEYSYLSTPVEHALHDIEKMLIDKIDSVAPTGGIKSFEINERILYLSACHEGQSVANINELRKSLAHYNEINTLEDLTLADWALVVANRLANIIFSENGEDVDINFHINPHHSITVTKAISGKLHGPIPNSSKH